MVESVDKPMSPGIEPLPEMLARARAAETFDNEGYCQACGEWVPDRAACAREDSAKEAAIRAVPKPEGKP